MRFYEFEAKKLLAKQGVRLPAGGTAKTPGEARKLASEVGGRRCRPPHIEVGAAFSPPATLTHRLPVSLASPIS